MTFLNRAQAPITLVVLLCTVLLSGCAHDSAFDAGAPVPDSQARFVSQDYRLAVDYPRELEDAHDFESDYFLGSRWDSSSDGNTAGAALLALTLPDSNKLIRGVMRIGASDDARAVDACLPAADTPNARSTRIHGVDFVRLDQGDAAMSHYSQVRSYRAVRDDQCIAIDLIVTGTRAAVYAAADRPEQPFTPDQAMDRLSDLLDGIHFLR